MKCPIDQTTLSMTSREGVEIDYCPKCRGIWLDRGELDKLIDRDDRNAGSHYQSRNEFHDGEDFEGRRQPRGRRGMLHNLFEVFD